MYSRRIGQEKAAVKVEKIKGTKQYRIVPGEISIVRSDAVVAELPRDCSVVNDVGKEIKPMGNFLITTETIDPYHLVIDMF